MYEVGKAVVVGAGIGGLTAALGLARVGWSAVVLEQAESLGEVGAGLSLWPNAMRGLDALGVGDAVRAVSATGVSRGSLRLPSGRWLRHAHPDDVPVQLVHRADLHRVLADALPGGWLRTGSTVTDVDDGMVVYDTAGGPRTEQADVVVGADGLRSAVRARHWPAARVEFDGRTVWRAVTEPDRPVGRASLTLGRTQQVGVLPLTDGRVYWFVLSAAAADGVRYDDEAGELRMRLAGWPEPIGALLDATPPERLLHHDIHVLEPLGTYVHGGTVLLGDAAHAQPPDLGQGACQAIEDAVALAAALGGEPDVAAGLARYDRERRPRTQAVVRAARAQTDLATRHYQMMTLVARLLPQPLWRRQTARWTHWTPPALTPPR